MWLKILAVAVFAFHFSIDPGWGEVIKTGFLFPLGAKVTELYLGCWGSSPDVSPCRSSPCSSSLLAAQIYSQLWWVQFRVSRCGQQNCPFLLALGGGLERVDGDLALPFSLPVPDWDWDTCIVWLKSSGSEKRSITALWWTWGCAPSLSWIENCFPKPKSAMQPQLELR